jgi:hypothetical protein
MCGSYACQAGRQNMAEQENARHSDVSVAVAGANGELTDCIEQKLLNYVCFKGDLAR